jgi:hypothetical protein
MVIRDFELQLALNGYQFVADHDAVRDYVQLLSTAMVNATCASRALEPFYPVASAI